MSNYKIEVRSSIRDIAGFLFLFAFLFIIIYSCGGARGNEGSGGNGSGGSGGSLEVSYSYNDFTLTKVCTYDDNWCGYADRHGKAVIYGEMSKAIEASSLYKMIDVTISIPCNGWGEGLAGPNGSSAHIIINDVIKEEKIDNTMPYHHGGYYKYEYCDSFTNTFDITDKTQIQLTIKMNNGARLDFQKANLKFY